MGALKFAVEEGLAGSDQARGLAERLWRSLSLSGQSGWQPSCRSSQSASSEPEERRAEPLADETSLIIFDRSRSR